MKLRDNFFRVKEFHPTATGADCTVGLLAEHFIYSAHFPGNPITPGVCIIQIVKELSEELVKRSLFLKEVHNVKFLNVINPLENEQVTFSITLSAEGADHYKVGAVVHNENGRFAKLSISLINR